MQVLYFKIPTCGPCAQMTPMIMEWGEATIVDASRQESQSLVEEHDIQAVPTMIVLDDDGVEIKRNVGYMGPAKFKEFVTV